VSLSGRSLNLNCAHQAFAACADGDYQPSLGVLEVPLIMVLDNYLSYFSKVWAETTFNGHSWFILVYWGAQYF
jgi:hypothetical protein